MSLERIWGTETTSAAIGIGISLTILAILLGLSWLARGSGAGVWDRRVAVAVAVITVGIVVSLRVLWNQYHLRLTSETVAIGTLLGTRTIRWSEVERLHRYWPGGRGLKGYRLRIEGHDESIVIYESTFAQPESLLAFVRRQVPEAPLTER